MYPIEPPSSSQMQEANRWRHDGTPLGALFHRFNSLKFNICPKNMKKIIKTCDNNRRLNIYTYTRLIDTPLVDRWRSPNVDW